MVTVADNIKTLMRKRGWSTRRLAKEANVSRITLTQLLLGQTKAPHLETLQAIASSLGATIDQLTENVDSVKITPQPNKPTLSSQLREWAKEAARLEKLSGESFPVPVRGNVPAGYPFAEEENMVETLQIPKEMLGDHVDPDTYALKISGDSLEGDHIIDGDYIIVSPHALIVDGDICVVRINDNETTVKHVFKQNGMVELRSSNPDYEPIKVPAADILGRVMGRWSKF